MRVHDIFSKRNEALPDIFVYDHFPQKLRNQLYHILDLTFGNALDHVCRQAKNDIDEAYRVILEEHGLDYISQSGKSPMVDIGITLKTNQNLYIWLDTVESMLRAICNYGYPTRFRIDAKSAVETANHRFRENGVGYQFDYESRQLIQVDNIVTHDQAVRPALHLLSGHHLIVMGGRLRQHEYRRVDRSCHETIFAVHETV